MKERAFANFGELLYWSYTNLQMLHYAIKARKLKYDQVCFMIRSKSFKAYKEGVWNIQDLMELNIIKIRKNNYYWYCGKIMATKELTKDHVFPRSKGGRNEMNNLIMACKTCNSSKGSMDLLKWYTTVQKEYPPIDVLIHYIKNIYIYSTEQHLMNKSLEEIDSMHLPFDWHHIPMSYPQPETFLQKNRLSYEK